VDKALELWCNGNQRERIFVKKKLIVCFLIILSFTVIGVTLKNIALKSASACLFYNTENLDSLIEDSQLIVVAQVTAYQTIEEFQKVDFAFTQLIVKKTLKDNGLVGDKIALLQTVADFDPIVEAGSDVLLFLEKYEGPIPGAEGAYVCKGLYQGNYIINGDKIVPTKTENAQLAADIEEVNSLSAMEAKVAAVGAKK
jgi:uncharacterized membrane protein